LLIEKKGVMSVKDSLKEFSVPTVVAYKEKRGIDNDALARGLQEESVFLQPVGEDPNQTIS
jgi:hypothetical protein